MVVVRRLNVATVRRELRERFLVQRCDAALAIAGCVTKPGKEHADRSERDGFDDQVVVGDGEASEVEVLVDETRVVFDQPNKAREVGLREAIILTEGSDTKAPHERADRTLLATRPMRTRAPWVLRFECSEVIRERL